MHVSNGVNLNQNDTPETTTNIIAVKGSTKKEKVISTLFKLIHVNEIEDEKSSTLKSTIKAKIKLIPIEIEFTIPGISLLSLIKFLNTIELKINMLKGINNISNVSISIKNNFSLNFSYNFIGNMFSTFWNKYSKV